MFVFPLIHNDNIYNSANPELKTVNLEPAQATRECLLGFPQPLSSNREKTHVGEEEELRVLCSGPPGGKKGAWSRSDYCVDPPQRNSSLYSSVDPLKAQQGAFRGMRAWRRRRQIKTRKGAQNDLHPTGKSETGTSRLLPQFST